MVFSMIVRKIKPISDIDVIENHAPNLYRKLNKLSEITLRVKGRKSGKNISRPVWFVNEDNTLYLLPNRGSDTAWYKNLLVDPTLKISADSVQTSARGKPITASDRVQDIVCKFQSKYGELNKYYTKFDVAVEVPLNYLDT